MFKGLKDIPHRILIVDDEKQIGDFLGDFLVDKGYEVFYAENGENAIRFLKYARPHIVLLDVHIAGMTGLEVLELIKDVDPKVGVIMVTALQEEEIGRKALKLCAVDYLTKPIDFEYLETSLTIKLSAMLE